MRCATCMLSKQRHTNSALSRQHAILEDGVSLSTQRITQPCNSLPFELVNTAPQYFSWLRFQAAAEVALLHEEGEAAEEERLVSQRTESSQNQISRHTRLETLCKCFAAPI